MKTNLQKLYGNWDAGYALDKHVLRSTFTGYNEFGHPTFDTERSEAGESLFQLKYRNDWAKAEALARTIFETIIPHFPSIGLIVPMPASTPRARQPVDEIAGHLGKLMDRNVFDKLVVKAESSSGKSLKNLTTKEEKQAELAGRFSIKDVLEGDGPWNALLVDDLFDTGASMEAAAAALRTYKKVKGVYVAAVSWK